MHISVICWDLSLTFEFSLNVFTEFAEFSDKIFVITAKGLEPATACVRDQDAATGPARHMWETGSLNWTQFKLQWFIRFPEFPEFLIHLGKTPLRFPICFLFLSMDAQWLMHITFITIRRELWDLLHTALNFLQYNFFPYDSNGLEINY